MLTVEIIETYWNVNVSQTRSFENIPSLEIIETYWNVNGLQILPPLLLKVEIIETYWNVNIASRSILKIICKK